MLDPEELTNCVVKAVVLLIVGCLIVGFAIGLIVGYLAN